MRDFVITKEEHKGIEIMQSESFLFFKKRDAAFSKRGVWWNFEIMSILLFHL